MAYKPPKLVLPMHIRKHNPMGYTHGQINWQGIKHPGYDLNDGDGAWADLNQPIYAPGDGRICYVGRPAGWGTLMVGYLAEKQIDPATGKLIHIGFRVGHPKRMWYGVGYRFEAGQEIATCGNGNQGNMTPHLHFDYFRRDRLEELGKNFIAKYGKKEAERVSMPYAYWDLLNVRDEFESLYIDPAHYHPELRKYSPSF